jgi:hypothetical protein
MSLVKGQVIRGKAFLIDRATACTSSPPRKRGSMLRQEIAPAPLWGFADAWIPAFAGMTKGGAGMTKGGAELTKREAIFRGQTQGLLAGAGLAWRWRRPE